MVDELTEEDKERLNKSQEKNEKTKKEWIEEHKRKNVITEEVEEKLNDPPLLIKE